MGDIKDLISVRDCSECRHKDHGGLIPRNKTKYMCAHPAQYEHRVIPNYPDTPNWCPLKRLKESEMCAMDQGSIPVIADQNNEPKSIGELVEEYVALRDGLSVERKKFKSLEETTKLEMEKIEVKILEVQRTLGLKSVSTGNFTAFQTTKTTVRVGDWDEFSKWILETGNIHCLEKRCAKLACLEIEVSEDNEEGVNLADIGLDKAEEIVIQVRKK